MSMSKADNLSYQLYDTNEYNKERQGSQEEKKLYNEDHVTKLQ